uniref:Uncharacterized protein n=1 Tax=Arundo donax TaxID=35708 RepID=A0A0A9G7J3_ARUDO
MRCHCRICSGAGACETLLDFEICGVGLFVAGLGALQKAGTREDFELCVFLLATILFTSEHCTAASCSASLRKLTWVMGHCCCLVLGSLPVHMERESVCVCACACVSFQFTLEMRHDGMHGGGCA